MFFEASSMPERTELSGDTQDASYPHPWGMVAIDAKGTAYTGNQQGIFYALADQDGDGLLQGESEVSRFDTGACRFVNRYCNSYKMSVCSLGHFR